MELNGKKIMVVAPLGAYSEAIRNIIEQMGGEAHCFEERPSLGFWVKFFIRYFPYLIRKWTQDYFDEIVVKTKGQNYDIILLIRGEAITQKFIVDLKSTHKNVKIVYYLWDSLNHTKGPLDKLHLCDKVLSFDKIDCEQYKLEFKPLFYLKEYAEISRLNKNNQYEFTFVGTIHSDRYKFIKEFRSIAQKRNKKVFFFQFLTSRIAFYKMKYFDGVLTKAKLSEFSLKPLAKADVLDVIAKSNIVIDAQHPAQTGLTMRTIEMLGAKRKLITTNSDIKTYDFYNPANIMIVDKDSIIISDQFLDSDYEDIDCKVYESYRIDNWLLTLLKGVI